MSDVVDVVIENIAAPVTLVLHHPHFFDASYWAGWSKLTGCNIMAFDAPHHGANTVDQSYREFAATTVARAREEFSTPLVVAGVSQGGVITQESSDQEQVAGVIGISTTRSEAPKVEIDAMHGLLEAWGDGYPADEIAAGIAQTSTNGQQPAMNTTFDVVKHFSGKQLQGSVPLLVGRRAVGELSVPSLFIHGTEDQTYSFADLVASGARVGAIAGGSHSAALQTPAIVAGHIRDFIAGLPVTPTR